MFVAVWPSTMNRERGLRAVRRYLTAALVALAVRIAREDRPRRSDRSSAPKGGLREPRFSLERRRRSLVSAERALALTSRDLRISWHTTSQVLIAGCGRVIGLSTLVLVLAAAGTACGGGENGQRSTLQPTTRTFVALADTYVRANEPSTSFGKNGELRVDDTPVARSYIRFDIFRVPGTIVRATLRLYTLTSSGDGFQVRASGDSWIESRTTYRNAPEVGRLIAQSGSFFANEWASIDVTPAVRSSSMTLDLALVGIGARQLAVASRERKGRAPQLVIVASQTTNP